jgi:5-formyltetrahydrofolate cyclo-ligase
MSSDREEAASRTSKDEVRQRIWALLDDRDAVQPPGSAGHIPSFVGAEDAARRLADLPVWSSARVVKSNPDRAQLPVRVQALVAGKVVYMAVPRLETVEPFYLLDPNRFDADTDLAEIATSQVAAESAPRVGTAQMPLIDIVICGSVAVDRRGVRVGKGAGYSDIEVALLIEAGLIGPATTIVTTVHDLQVVEESIPDNPHDFRVDYIVTPTQVLECARSRRPTGVDWDRLTSEQLAAIPVLRQLHRTVQDRQTSPGL